MNDERRTDDATRLLVAGALHRIHSGQANRAAMFQQLTAHGVPLQVVARVVTTLPA
ncbi:MAG: hypothetical protein KDH20_15865 [Rhodocyclaceae bacterium]|nr:hypothetical protein [Rhodocyclaceae bacterium]